MIKKIELKKSKSRKETLKKANFTLVAPNVQNVLLTGDFNAVYH